MLNQHTLKYSIKCSGTGIHTGKNVEMTLNPGDPGTGIIFRRVDVGHATNEVHALYDMVEDTVLGTRISNEYGVTVSTIEHLMAALWGSNIDNAVVELNASEVPIMDGSSEPFQFLIDCAGIAEQPQVRQYLKVLKAVEVSEGDAYARLEPNDSFVVALEIDFPNPIIGRQMAVYDFGKLSFKSTVSRARTFGFEHEVNYLRSQGLALGGTLDNAIVLGRDSILNPGGLRFNDEFVRHKILDCVGDLYLAGYGIKGGFTGYKSGHGLNNRLLHALFADSSNWMLTGEGYVSAAQSTYLAEAC